jgi:hypothetical protein
MKLSAKIINLPARIELNVSRKMLGFHDGDYDECRRLGCYAVWLL